MVPVPVGGGYCIDSTEVTYANYEPWAQSKGINTPGPSPLCTWNTLYLAPVTLLGGNPVTGINWCAAYTYCRDNGKRLCGALKGGQAPIIDGGSLESEWYVACSHNGTRTYPYGSTYEAGACNDDAGSLANAGSFTRCVGGYPGLFDMTGNAAEWENACEDDGGNPDPDGVGCRIRGGAFDFGTTFPATCNDEHRVQARSAIYAEVGFRCCYP
jgi:formylglycine-generating enzyme required for sulfatase activity